MPVTNTNRRFAATAATLLSLGTADWAWSEQVRIDFGTASSPSRGAAGARWNEIVSPLGSAPAPLIDFSSGATLPWTAAVTRPFLGGSVDTGTRTPTGAAAARGFVGSATRDSFLSLAQLDAGQVTLRNLDPALAYSFDLFASTTAGEGDRSGHYVLTGRNTVAGILDARGNHSNVLTLAGVRPAADGTITLDVRGAPSNQSEQRQAHLNALTVTSAPLPPAKNLLFFGNSFTAMSNVPGMVGDLAASAGHRRPYVVAEAVDSRDLDNQIAEVRLRPQNNVHKLPAGQRWDSVVIQEFSSEPTHVGDPADFRADAVTLYDLVRAGSPAVTPVLYETWAYQPGSDAYSPTPQPWQWTGPHQMQQELRENYNLAAADIDAAAGQPVARVARVGDEWEQAGFPADFYGGFDNKHASTVGSALAALEIYSTIYGDDVGDIPWAAVEIWAGARGLTARDWLRITHYVDHDPGRTSTDGSAGPFPDAAVPEPASLAVIAVTPGALARRRRRSSPSPL